MQCITFFFYFNKNAFYVHPFLKFIYFSWRLITLQYCGCFCHALTWISHEYTCVLHPEPPPSPPSPSHPSRSSQCTSPEHPVSCIEPGLEISFTYDNIHVSVLFFKSPLDFKQIQSVHPKGNRSWVFTGSTDVQAETPVFWPSDAKSWLIWKDPDVGKDWRQEKGATEIVMVRWHHQLNGHEFGKTLGSWWWTGRPGVLWFMGLQRVGHDWAGWTELNWTDIGLYKFLCD